MELGTALMTDTERLHKLARLGRDMRRAQTDYFRRRTGADLQVAKDLERQFDAQCDDLLADLDLQGRLNFKD